ncbi:Uncharacterized protein SAMN05216577_11351 [Pseudomonas citronellolis]|uniref:Photosynthesis system II assembly factor Ycf48/Hcf136-like domain-containing protein n=1 Tax=Pseudomonas citronellolis TaxID=53408 RepID=A0AAQ1KGA9_9PSED|nr:YCF48-related protein [Pseudomonas citronellolis]MCP1603101.1 photosystem II stability/assembly factor-like uncharacterized protein [Pseudomonas citronellolis]MCP1654159.1 photosystem II stability/assembly factor-like uncharacterized protein [Pseudomonas citronellolis]MCP1720944.1 photosystem II stability/assembly factor-like uncharacterized protein [Pseudomonas citronellolis]TGC21472.1 hypothetical protein CW310_29725 [Pseudomonas citronellolis]SFC94516.1 Uncharacterized protein SAMN052165
MQIALPSGSRRRVATRPWCSSILAVSLVLVSGAFGAGAPAALPLADADSRPALHAESFEQAAILALQDTGRRLVAVGERGLILLSEDGGRHWRQARVPVSVTLTAVRFPTPEQGWAVGHFGTVLHSDDGGLSWSVQLRGGQAAQLVLDEAQARDGADSQSSAVSNAQRLVEDGPDKPFLDLHFADEKHGFVIGAYNLILRTDDGGRSWQSLSTRLDNPGSRHLYAIAGAGAYLYIVGEEGRVFRSADHGASFTRLNTPYQGSYFTVSAHGDSLVVAGLRGNAFRSDDHGQSWSRLALPQPVSVVASQLQRDGSVLLLDQAGQLWQGGSSGTRLEPLARTALPAPTAMLRNAAGELLVSSLQGIAQPAMPAQH